MAALHPALVLAVAHAWLGTPWAPRQSVRGAGCDCIGLVRGVWRDLTGADVPVPGWSPDWAVGPGDTLADAIAAHADPVPVAAALPGHVVTWRWGGRVRHVGILAPGGRYYHAPSDGRVRCDTFCGRAIASAWALRAHPAAVTGRPDLTAADCVAVLYPLAGRNVMAQITDALTGQLVAVTPTYADADAALDALSPVFPFIESME